MSNSFDAIQPILEAAGSKVIEVLDPARCHIECPGKHLHTTANADADCTLFFNEDGTVIADCYHQSCRDCVKQLNAALYHFTRQAGRIPAPIEVSKTTMRAQQIMHERIKRTASETLSGIVKDYAWALSDIEAAEPELREIPVCDHWQYLWAGLYHEEEIVWCGRDVWDTRSPKHRWRFLSVGEWLGRPECPGVFTCPSTFKPGIYSRKDRNVAVRKYLVVESDKLDHAQIASVFRWLESSEGMTLRAIVDTAGKSLHGWFDYPPANRLAKWKRLLPSIGCDPRMFTPSQPCRLPGAIRPDSGGRYQRLLYLNPQS